LRTAAAVAGSLVLNYVILLILPVDGVVGALKAPPRPQNVGLAPLSQKAWEANRRIASAKPPSPSHPAAPEPPPPPPSKNGQVVDVAPSQDHTPPKDSRFLAEQNNRVEKETRSRYHENKVYEHTAPKPTGPAEAVAGGDGARRPGVPAPAQPPANAQQSRRQTGRDKLALQEAPGGKLKRTLPRHEMRGTGEPLAASPAQPPVGEPGAPGNRGLSGLQLRPSANAYERLSGGPAPDKLDGVQEGEGTYLNTTEFKYAGYMNSIYREMYPHWDPATPMRSRDPTGARFGRREWTTWLTFKLDEHGALKDVSVARSSGLDFMDAAAVQAVRTAQPFPNPPVGLADERHEIVLNWGFTFSYGLENGGFSALFGRPGE
jgi:TonB family protein